jgi:hypothetical protein
MLSSSQRMAVRVHRRETQGWPVWLSLALHLTLFLFLLMIPPTQPLTTASGPPTVDLILGEGPAEATSEPPAPTEAPAAPTAPSPPVQQAEIPPPTPAPAPMPVSAATPAGGAGAPVAGTATARRRSHSGQAGGGTRARAGRAECREPRERCKWHRLDGEAEAVVGPALLLSEGGVADQ